MLSIPFRGIDEEFSCTSSSNDVNDFSSDNNDDSRLIGNNRGIVGGFTGQYQAR